MPRCESQHISIDTWRRHLDSVCTIKPRSSCMSKRRFKLKSPWTTKTPPKPTPILKLALHLPNPSLLESRSNRGNLLANSIEAMRGMQTDGFKIRAGRNGGDSHLIRGSNLVLNRTGSLRGELLPWDAANVMWFKQHVIPDAFILNLCSAFDKIISNLRHGLWYLHLIFVNRSIGGLATVSSTRNENTTN